MNRIDGRAIVFAALLGAGGLGWAGPAQAQATRTWVSGVGDDANPCSRTAPCKTFAGAISKTAAGGEINCLDPGGFGAVTITKSISIVCDFTEAGVLATAGISGVTVNAGAADVVFLSGLDFHGAGSGGNGIRILAGGAVHIQNSRIRNFNAADGRGISVTPTGATDVIVTNVTISNNGSGATGGGMHIQPTGNGSTRVTLRSVVLQNNINDAIRIVAPTNAGTGIVFIADDIQVIGSSDGLDVAAPDGSTNVRGMITNSLFANNSVVGVRVNGATISLQVGNTTITQNNGGVSRGQGAILNTYGTNRLDGNTTNGSFTAPPLPQQ